MNRTIREIISFVWANRKYKRLLDKVVNETDPIKKRAALLKAVKFGDKYNIKVP